MRECVRGPVGVRRVRTPTKNLSWGQNTILYQIASQDTNSALAIQNPLNMRFLHQNSQSVNREEEEVALCASGSGGQPSHENFEQPVSCFGCGSVGVSAANAQEVGGVLLSEC